MYKFNENKFNVKVGQNENQLYAIIQIYKEYFDNIVGEIEIGEDVKVLVKTLDEIKGEVLQLVVEYLTHYENSAFGTIPEVLSSNDLTKEVSLILQGAPFNQIYV